MGLTGFPLKMSKPFSLPVILSKKMPLVGFEPTVSALREITGVFQRVVNLLSQIIFLFTLPSEIPLFFILCFPIPVCTELY